MMLPPRKKSAPFGFTLVEVLTVIVLMAIVAAVLLTNVNSAVTDAQVATAQEIVMTVRRKVNAEAVLNKTFPAELDANWFTPQVLPSNPFKLEMKPGRGYIDTSDDPKLTHPANKTLQSGSPYWYNPTNGVFRMRVPAQGTAAATLELYNRCNGTQLTQMSDTRSL